ncbi:MAG: acetyl-CoA carboxylase carboxyltransferase subunit alpha [Puniceicoccales bacterium]|jgi:acetyl-CoA carboxylase carboxyl transferase subunit alpha|nr:acetyl-CoA carboxylase carboxyltransferase subunit alpha [Puniceicoccales bacterium]
METSVKYTLDFEKPLLALSEQLEQLKRLSDENQVQMDDEIHAIEIKIKETQEQIYKNLTPWQKIKIARHPQRPYALDYIQSLFENFQELHGDRYFGDDQALIGGSAFFEKKPVMVIAQQKGRSLKENIKRCFGSPNPEGYRKALRLMRLAEKFKMPIIAWIDTPGAYPGIGAEERHVAEAIAVNLREMSTLKVPSIAIVLGEGGSGGALGIGVVDRVLILENAYYSVISPEGCAAILWKDRAKAPEAANALKLSANHLKNLNVVDAIIPEPLGGAHADPASCIENVRCALETHLTELLRESEKDLLAKRYRKFRSIGVFEEHA